MPQRKAIVYAIWIVACFYAFLIGFGIYLQTHRSSNDLVAEKPAATIGH